MLDKCAITYPEMCLKNQLCLIIIVTVHEKLYTDIFLLIWMQFLYWLFFIGAINHFYVFNPDKMLRILLHVIALHHLKFLLNVTYWIVTSSFVACGIVMFVIALSQLCGDVRDCFCIHPYFLFLIWIISFFFVFLFH